MHRAHARFPWRWWLLAGGVVAAGGAGAGGQDVVPGAVCERVACRADPVRSYAVYVPSGYTPDRTWPVVLCFDPLARGAEPVRRFRDGAERLGYIIAGSNDSRNGPIQATVEAADAMWRDLNERFSVDRKRVVAAGFSGGARVASMLGTSGFARGVIAAGAGFPERRPPERVGFPFVGVAGVDDFNFPEMRQTDRELAGQRAVHRLFAWDGGHELMPADVATAALGWIELHGMRSAVRPVDDAVVHGLLADGLARLERMRGLEAVDEAAALVEDFRGLADTADLERTAAGMAANPEVRRWRRSEAAQARKQQQALDSLLALARDDVPETLASRIADLKAGADTPEDSPERRLARRTLDGTFATALELATGREQAGDFKSAAWMLRLVIAIHPGRPRTHVDLARVLARDGRGKAALDALLRAAEAGYRDAERIEQEPAFARLREDPRFQEAIAAMRP